MLVKKVYDGWAFDEHEGEKSRINQEIYKELFEKYKISIVYDKNNLNLDDFDIVIYSHYIGYQQIHKILKNDVNLTLDELALVCDSGNLCFGYIEEFSGIHIFTD